MKQLSRRVFLLPFLSLLFTKINFLKRCPSLNICQIMLLPLHKSPQGLLSFPRVKSELSPRYVRTDVILSLLFSSLNINTTLPTCTLKTLASSCSYISVISHAVPLSRILTLMVSLWLSPSGLIYNIILC